MHEQLAEPLRVRAQASKGRVCHAAAKKVEVMMLVIAFWIHISIRQCVVGSGGHLRTGGGVVPFGVTGPP